jgi:hypothetical protein
MVVAGRRGDPADLLVRPCASVSRRPAPWHRHRRIRRRCGCRAVRRSRLVLGNDARKWADPQHPHGRRIHRLADAPRLAGAAHRRNCRRVGGRRDDRAERDARARRAVRPSRHPRDERRERVCRSALAAARKSRITATVGAPASAVACDRDSRAGADYVDGCARRAAHRAGDRPSTAGAAPRSRAAASPRGTRSPRRAFVVGRKQKLARYGCESRIRGTARPAAVARSRAMASSRACSAPTRASGLARVGSADVTAGPADTIDSRASAPLVARRCRGSAYATEARFPPRPEMVRPCARCRRGLRPRKDAFAVGTYH